MAQFQTGLAARCKDNHVLPTANQKLKATTLSPLSINSR
jgi:hypothetical protein